MGKIHQNKRLTLTTGCHYASTLQICLLWLGFPCCTSGKEHACRSRKCLIPGSGRSPGGGHGNTLQYSCLENPKDRGSWQATVQRDTKIQTQLNWLSSSNRSFGYRHESCGGTGALWEAIRKVWNRMPASQLKSLASILLNIAKLEAPLHGSGFQRTEREVCQEQVLTNLHTSLPFTNLYFLRSQIPPLLSSPDCTWPSSSYHNLGNLESSPLSKGQDRRGWQFPEWEDYRKYSRPESQKWGGVHEKQKYTRNPEEEEVQVSHPE